MTKYHYCLLLMGGLLLGGCQSVEQLSIDYMLPAEVSFPAILSTRWMGGNLSLSRENASKTS